MGVNFKLIFILTGLIFILSSCRTSAPRLDYQALARASILLGVDINMEDNHKLYLESAEWIGVPYRGGGDSKRGTDCSGLTYQIYRKVYRTQVPRNTEDLRKESTKVAKRNLRVQSPNQKIPDRKTKCVIKTHINIKQNVIFGAKLKPV